MKKRPTILLTNDDGIDHPGLHRAWKALSHKAELYIVAPACEQSSTGLSITLRTPLEVKKAWIENAWSVSGTPVDSVKMAVGLLLLHKPDFIISGINPGNNAGRNIFYSGTVGGAIEGAIQGIPSLAISSINGDESSFVYAEALLSRLLDYMIQHPLPLGTLLNVNIPSDPKGVQLTRQGRQHYGEKPCLHEGSSYWMGGEVRLFDEHEESDICWLSRGYATVVPLYIGELTHHNELSKRKEDFYPFFDHDSLARKE